MGGPANVKGSPGLCLSSHFISEEKTIGVCIVKHAGTQWLYSRGFLIKSAVLSACPAPHRQLRHLIRLYTKQQRSPQE